MKKKARKIETLLRIVSDYFERLEDASFRYPEEAEKNGWIDPYYPEFSAMLRKLREEASISSSFKLYK